MTAELALGVLDRYGLATLMLLAVSLAAWKMWRHQETKLSLLATYQAEHLEQVEAAHQEKIDAKIERIDRLQSEVGRLNEIRIQAAADHGERLLTMAKESSELLEGSNRTLTLVGQRMGDWHQSNEKLTDAVREQMARAKS